MKLTAIALSVVFASLAANTTDAYEISFGVDAKAQKSLVHKVPISHRLEGVLSRGSLLYKAESVPDRLKIDNVNGLGAAEFQFSNGRLTQFVRDGNEQDKDKDATYLANSEDDPVKLHNLWRNLPEEEKLGWKFWEKSSRYRLWFFNPNGAGTLFAEIALLLLSLAAFASRRKLVRFLLLGCAVAATAMLLLTGSRGSLIALALGFAVIAVSFARLRKLQVNNYALIVLTVVALAAIIIWIGGPRFTSELLSIDVGNVYRLRAWRAAPAMIAAAPDGWGENCGKAYCEWFQNEDESHLLYYLVNTHLTWMAGKGWLFSAGYVLAWALLFAALTANFRKRRSAVALAMWFLFFVANWFSTLGQFATLWIIPVFCSIPAALEYVGNFKVSKMRNIIALVVAPLVAAVALGSVIAVGNSDLAKMDVPVRKDGNIVRIGNGEPLAYIVPDQWVLCRYNFGGMGRDIRSWYKTHANGRAVAVVDSIDQLPVEAERFVLVGRSCREYMLKMKRSAKGKTSLAGFPRAKHTVFISPNLETGKISGKLAKALHLKIYTGEFLAEVAGDLSVRQPWARIVPSCELYLPNWLVLAMGGEEQ